MMQLIAFGLAIGAGIQSLRSWPADGPVTQDAMAVAIILATVLAFLGGRAVRKPTVVSATATATATATAQQSVNVALFAPGAGAAATGTRFPSEAAPWMVGAHTAPELTADLVEGMALDDFVESRDHEESSVDGK